MHNVRDPTDSVTIALQRRGIGAGHAYELVKLAFCLPVLHPMAANDEVSQTP